MGLVRRITVQSQFLLEVDLFLSRNRKKMFGLEFGSPVHTKVGDQTVTCSEQERYE